MPDIRPARDIPLDNSMSKTSSILCAAGGAFAGVAITWAIMAGNQATPPPPAGDSPREERPEEWLLAPGTTLGDIFKEDGMHILEAPDAVTLHELSTEPPGDAPDAIVHDGHAFQAAGTAVTVDEVLYTVRSISSYRSITMCEFRPGVLLRLTRDGRHLDLAFCFSCHDIQAYLDGELCGGAGMSDQGSRSFVHYFRKILPGNEGLRAVRDSL